MIETIVAFSSPFVSAAAEQLAKRFRREEPMIEVVSSDTDAALRKHLEYAARWCGAVNFADLPRKKHLNDVFVDLDLSLTPRRRQIEGERVNSIHVSSLAGRLDSAVVLGDPGAGKTTSLKKLCGRALSECRVGGSTKLVLVVVLRELGDDESLISRAFLELDVHLKHIAGYDIKAEWELLRREFVEFIGEMHITLFVDGLDEISGDLRQRVEGDLRFILQRGRQNARVILTCRSADFHFNLPECSVYEITPLNKSQVNEFVHRWLVQEAAARQFLADLEQTPFADTAIRPLTLSHLCAIYERTGRIPQKPKTIYRKIVYLLLKEWDEHKGVIRKSVYGRFEPDRKQDFLEHLSFFLTREYSTASFSHEQLKSGYETIAPSYRLPRAQALEVAREIESHTGLIAQSGFETYEFTHKSLQEYLAAEFIVKYPTSAEFSDLVEWMPNEIAISVALSSAPSVYLSQLLNRLLPTLEPNGHASSLRPFAVFFGRLLLERPDFGYHENLALTLIRFGTACCGAFHVYLNSVPGSSADIERVYTDLCKLFKDEEVHNAVQDALLYYRIEPSVNLKGFYELEPGPRAIQSAYPIASAVLPKEFLAGLVAEPEASKE